MMNRLMILFLCLAGVGCAGVDVPTPADATAPVEIVSASGTGTVSLVIYGTPVEVAVKSTADPVCVVVEVKSGLLRIEKNLVGCGEKKPAPKEGGDQDLTP